VSAPLAYRVAVSVIPSLGARRKKAAADPFAEPGDGPPVPGGAGVPSRDGGAAAEPAAGAAGGQATALLDADSRRTDGGLA
jgi:hypothetical protein